MNNLSGGFVIAIITTIVGIMVLILTVLQLRQNDKIRQLRITIDTFNRLQNLEKELNTLKTLSRKRQWDSQFFNTLELFAFLINEKFLKNKKMIHFFKDGIVEWYEQIYVKHYPAKVHDKKHCEELKKLYLRLVSKPNKCIPSRFVYFL